MSTVSPTVDKAGHEYWDNLWESADAHGAPEELSWSERYVMGQLERYIGEMIRHHLPEAQSILEAGCARSTWLPWFAQELGLEVAGLDYSESGVDQARAILARAGLEGDVAFGDIFDPPARMLDRFDLVISFGLVEHFADTSQAIGALARLVRPGGLLITDIPNLSGSLGTLQRALDKEILDLHVRLDREDLATAHEATGDLDVLDCRYVVSTNYAVCHVPRRGHSVPGWYVRRALQYGATAISRLAWTLETMSGRTFRTSRLVSPYVYCVARRRG